MTREFDPANEHARFSYQLTWTAVLAAGFLLLVTNIVLVPIIQADVRVHPAIRTLLSFTVILGAVVSYTYVVLSRHETLQGLTKHGPAK